jgi:biopolymer transport protein ExbD/biopolymer transport protein TolR
MRIGDPARLQSSINVTPLVDVVLVLLIVFMVMAPHMRHGPGVELPQTERPQDQAGDGLQIFVTIEHGGELWVDSDRVTAERLPDGLRAAAGNETDPKVVIQGDARLSFGQVRRAMLAVEEAGFHDVGLIAERATRPTTGR